MKSYSSSFGTRLREKRLLRNYTKEDLSEKLDISVSYLGLLERNERQPSYALLLKISTLLGASIDELIFGKNINEAHISKQTVLNEREIAGLQENTHWMEIDKEIALGMAIGRVVKGFKFDENQFSYIAAALYHTVCTICEEIKTGNP